MYKPSTKANPESQRDLKQDFEAALNEFYEEDPKAIAHRTPIVQRQRAFSGPVDPKKQALSMAASALATLWGV
ncbi:MAG: hypothetical protein ACRD2U_08785 [Terriglobales bacterium]